MRWWPWPRRTEGRADAPEAGLRAELAQARLDLAERDEALRRARDDLARERGQGQDRERESADVETAGLVSVISTPLAQLVTLNHLREAGTVDPAARDVLAIAMRLVGALADRDVHPAGAVGEQEPFDPDRHEPVGAASPEPGAPVVVRFVGFTYRSRVLRKAGIEPAENGSEV